MDTHSKFKLTIKMGCYAQYYRELSCVRKFDTGCSQMAGLAKANSCPEFGWTMTRRHQKISSDFLVVICELPCGTLQVLSSVLHIPLYILQFINHGAYRQSSTRLSAASKGWAAAWPAKALAGCLVLPPLYLDRQQCRGTVQLHCTHYHGACCANHG